MAIGIVFLGFMWPGEGDYMSEKRYCCYLNINGVAFEIYLGSQIPMTIGGFELRMSYTIVTPSQFETWLEVEVS